MSWNERTIVVTGAAQGIGLAVAQAFAAVGANLALIDANEEKLRLAAAQLGGSVTVRAYPASVADEQQVTAAMDRIAADFGRLDGLVNNAGIVRDALLVKTREGAVVGRMTLQQWQAVIDVNLTGVFLCGRSAAEWMVKFGHGGVIVNVSSISRHGNVGQTNYSAAKAGVTAMTEVWARELARHRIRTGSVAPGFVGTEILESMKPEMLDKLLSPVPVGRLGTPAEIARAVMFIFDNEFFTGRCIDIDGGLRL